MKNNLRFKIQTTKLKRDENFYEITNSKLFSNFADRAVRFRTKNRCAAEAIEMAIEGVESADFLSEEQKRDIFCSNAARFMKWEGKNNPCRVQK